MDKIAFCSVVESVNDNGKKYRDQQIRMAQSITNSYEGLPEPSIMLWHNSLPDRARPFLDSLYGFKPHAIGQCLNAGFKKIVWMDSAMILHRPIQIDLPFVAIKDSSQLQASDYALEWFGLKREQIQGLNLVGGSFYYFDFEYMATNNLFQRWRQAELSGCFGSQHEESFAGLQGHRHDETCMRLCMLENDILPAPGNEVGYNGEVMTKDHFK
jgi:hypothetical protein